MAGNANAAGAGRMGGGGSSVVWVMQQLCRTITPVHMGTNPTVFWKLRELSRSGKSGAASRRGGWSPYGSVESPELFWTLR